MVYNQPLQPAWLFDIILFFYLLNMINLGWSSAFECSQKTKVCFVK
jgi:hypothetical protein